MIFISALFIRNLRLVYGRNIYLLITSGCAVTLAALGQWQWALMYFSISLVIGLYREMEETGLSIFLGSAVAVLLTAGSGVLAIFGYSQMANVPFYNILEESLSPSLQALQKVPQFKEATIQSVIGFLPSAVIILLMGVVFVSLTVSLVPLNQKQRFQLKMFHLPEFMIWVFILSLAGSFVKTQLGWLSLISINVLGVALAAYFFQGLAVLSHFMDRLSIFGFWRWMVYFLVFFQAFFMILLSLLGIVDYWWEFRSKGLSGSNQKSIDKV
jgi:hypothetical protein